MGQTLTEMVPKRYQHVLDRQRKSVRESVLDVLGIQSGHTNGDCGRFLYASKVEYPIITDSCRGIDLVVSQKAFCTRIVLGFDGTSLQASWSCPCQIGHPAVADERMNSLGDFIRSPLAIFPRPQVSPYFFIKAYSRARDNPDMAQAFGMPPPHAASSSRR